MKKEAEVMFHKDRFEKRYNDILKEIIKDLESAVIKLKKLND